MDATMTSNAAAATRISDETLAALRGIPTQTLIDALWVMGWPMSMIEGCQTAATRPADGGAGGYAALCAASPRPGGRQTERGWIRPNMWPLSAAAPARFW